MNLSSLSLAHISMSYGKQSTNYCRVIRSYPTSYYDPMISKYQQKTLQLGQRNVVHGQNIKVMLSVQTLSDPRSLSLYGR